MSDVGRSKRARLEAALSGANADSLPASFSMHFDSTAHFGSAAIDEHVRYYRTIDSDLLKVQYEGPFLSQRILHPEDWVHLDPLAPSAFQDPIAVLKGVAEQLRGEVYVLMTIYSPFMWALRAAGAPVLQRDVESVPSVVAKAIDRLTEMVVQFVGMCKRVGVDGFYIATQGAEATRFGSTDFFQTVIKPSDLQVWEAASGADANVLHICDYRGTYRSLLPFKDYPGAIVSAPYPTHGPQTPKEMVGYFDRPFFGGIQREGFIHSDSVAQISSKMERVLRGVQERRYVVGANCTVPSTTPWRNIEAAVKVAHQFGRAAERPGR